ncbi:unnamed protein product [Rhizophagus irregularis]|nr:unnamed protein product [Rhizophagus irregularis]
MLLCWSSFISRFTEKRGLGKPSKWFNDVYNHVTVPDSDGLLLERFRPTITSSISAPSPLLPCDQSDNKKRYWVMSINDDGFPVFGKQIAIQLKHQKCTLSHWVMDDSLPANSPILLRRCPVL